MTHPCRVRSRQPMTPEQYDKLEAVRLAEVAMREAVRAAWLADLSTGQICKAARIAQKRLRDWVDDLPGKSEIIAPVYRCRSGVRMPDERRKELVRLILEDKRPQYVIAQMMGCTVQTVIRVWNHERTRWGIKFVPTWGNSKSKKGRANGGEARQLQSNGRDGAGVVQRPRVDAAVGLPGPDRAAPFGAGMAMGTT